MPEEREGLVYGVESLRMQTWMRFCAHADSDNGFSPLENKLEGENLKHSKNAKYSFQRTINAYLCKMQCCFFYKELRTRLFLLSLDPNLRCTNMVTSNMLVNVE